MQTTFIVDKLHVRCDTLNGNVCYQKWLLDNIHSSLVVSVLDLVISMPRFKSFLRISTNIFGLLVKDKATKSLNHDGLTENSAAYASMGLKILFRGHKFTNYLH